MKKSGPVIVLAALAAAAAGCVSSGDGQGRRSSSPDDAAQIHYELGSEYLRQNRLKLARERLELAVELDPDLARARMALALLYEKLGDPRLAEEQYRAAVRVAPDDANVQNAYGVFLCGKRRFEEAERYFNTAAGSIEYGLPEVPLTNAGVCFTEKPDLEKAERYFRRALDRNREYGEALLQLASVQHRQGEHLRARAFIERFLAGSDATAEALLLAVRVETALGDRVAAARYAEELKEKFPASVQAEQLREGPDAG